MRKIVCCFSKMRIIVELSSSAKHIDALHRPNVTSSHALIFSMTTYPQSKIHFIDSSSIKNLKLQITSALQLSFDSFYLLQWFYSSVISKSRRHAVSYMHRFAAQMRILEYSVVRLYRATGRLAFGDSFEALPFSMPNSLVGDGSRWRRLGGLGPLATSGPQVVHTARVLSPTAAE